MNQLRCGFVGAGAIMRVHADALSKREDVTLAALSDIAPAVLNASADQFDIPGRYTSYKEMFEKEALDFAIICVPNAFHVGATLAGLEADCHVLCEKPPAMNVDQAIQMAQAAEKRNLRLAYGLHMRFMSVVETGRSYLEAGRLGEVYHASIQMFRRRGIPGLGSWFTTKAIAGGGALIDVGVHEVDRAHYLMGQPKPIAASAVTHARFGTDPENYNYLNMWATRVPGGPFDVEDFAVGIIRFEGGASLVLQVSWAANTPADSSLRIMGTKGGLYIDAAQTLKVVTEDNGFNADITPQFNKQDVRSAQLANFIDCIRDPEKKLRTDARQGIILQHMLDAFYKSAETGREVRIDMDE